MNLDIYKIKRLFIVAVSLCIIIIVIINIYTNKKQESYIQRGDEFVSMLKNQNKKVLARSEKYIVYKDTDNSVIRYNIQKDVEESFGDYVSNQNYNKLLEED